MALSREQIAGEKSAYDLITESLRNTPDFGMEGNCNLEATYHFKCRDRKMLDKLIELNSSAETHKISIEITPAKKSTPSQDTTRASLPTATKDLKRAATMPPTTVAPAKKAKGHSETMKAAESNGSNAKKQPFIAEHDSSKATGADSRTSVLDGDKKLPALKAPPPPSMASAAPVSHASKQVGSVASSSKAETVSDSDSYCEIVEPSSPLKNRSKTSADGAVEVDASASTKKTKLTDNYCEIVEPSPPLEKRTKTSTGGNVETVTSASVSKIKHTNSSKKILVALLRLTLLGKDKVPDDYDTLMSSSAMKDVPNDLLALFAEYDACNPGFEKAISPLRREKHAIGKGGSSCITREGFEYVKNLGINVKPVQNNYEAQGLLLKKTYVTAVQRNIFQELLTAGGSMAKAVLATKRLSKEMYEDEHAQGFKKALSQMKQTKLQGKTKPFKFQLVDYDTKDIRLTDLAYPMGRPGSKK